MLSLYISSRIVSFLPFFFSIVHPYHLRLALTSQGNALSRLVGGRVFQKFRGENDPELGEVYFKFACICTLTESLPSSHDYSRDLHSGNGAKLTILLT